MKFAAFAMDIIVCSAQSVQYKIIDTTTLSEIKFYRFETCEKV